MNKLEVKIIPELNIETAKEKGYKWTRDILYPQDEMDGFYEMLNEKGYVLGSPKINKENSYYGLYESVVEEEINFLPDLVDMSLTPKNANERGYEYMRDIIYQIDAPYEVMESIIKAVEENGYKLGRAFGDTSIFTGIYEPIKKK